MFFRRVMLVLAIGLFGCAKPPPPKAPEPPPEPKALVKKLIAEMYAAIEAQEPERLNELLVPDVAAFGLGPKDSFQNRDTVVDFLRQELIPLGLKGEQLKVVRTRPLVGLSWTEESAWFTDFPRVERRREGKPTQTWALRVTGHAMKEGTSWHCDALHVSLAYPDADLYNTQVSMKLRPPESPGDERAKDADQVVGLSKRMLEDIALKVERTWDTDETVLIGTDPADVYVGGKKFKDFATPKLPELKKAQFSLKIEAGPRARLSPDGKTGWVAAIVVLRIGAGKKMQTLPAFRVLWTFTEEKDLWRMTTEHQSLGLLPDQRTQGAEGMPPDEAVSGANEPAPSVSDAGVVDVPDAGAPLQLQRRRLR